jgi:hypothetical protein
MKPEETPIALNPLMSIVEKLQHQAMEADLPGSFGGTDDSGMEPPLSWVT